MDPVISDLLDRYETGRLSRRELVAGLSALAAVSAAPASAQPPVQSPPPALKPTGIDHVSILVADLQRSADFYNRVFGLVPNGRDDANKILRLGPKPAPGERGKVIVSIRQQPPAGMDADPPGPRAQARHQRRIRLLREGPGRRERADGLSVRV